MTLIQWFITRAIILWIVIIAVIGIVIWIGSRQPMPESITALHLTECELPCWIGIIPGKTTLEEADQRLKSYYGNQPDYKVDKCSYDSRTYSIVNKVTAQPYLCVWIEDEHGQGIVNQIRIDFDPYTAPTLGDLMVTLGQPTSVSGWLSESMSNDPVILYKNRYLAMLYEDGNGSYTTYPSVSTLASRIYLDDSYTWNANHPFFEMMWSGFRLYRDVGIGK